MQTIQFTMRRENGEIAVDQTIPAFMEDGADFGTIETVTQGFRVNIEKGMSGELFLALTVAFDPPLVVQRDADQ